MTKQLYMSGIPQSTIDMWRAEVEALPLRKRAKWSKSCRDDYGVYRLTRYYNGHFQVKVRPCTGKGEVRLPESGWAPVIAHDGIVHRIHSWIRTEKTSLPKSKQPAVSQLETTLPSGANSTPNTNACWRHLFKEASLHRTTPSAA